MHKKISSVIVAILLVLAACSLAQGYRARGMLYSGRVPKPVLITPTTEKVDLTSKDELQFKWSPHEGSTMDRQYYDFRLYKGYQMIESTILFKKQVSYDEYQLKLNSDMFRNGEIYTWSLRQVYYLGKSQRSWQSFKIIK